MTRSGDRKQGHFWLGLMLVYVREEGLTTELGKKCLIRSQANFVVEQMSKAPAFVLP